MCRAASLEGATVATHMFAFVFSAGLIACFVWFEAWSRGEEARAAAAHKAEIASEPQLSVFDRTNQYSSLAKQP